MSPVKKVSGPNDPPEPTVLFVDDEQSQLRAYEDLFRQDPIRVLTAPSGLHALNLLQAEKVHLVVSDFILPGMDGNALLREVGRLYPETGRLLLTGGADSEIVLDAPCRVLTKGMDIGLVKRAILREVFRHA